MSNRLQAFLRSGRSRGALTHHQLQGFLYAVLSAPELIPPSEWMPLVFGDDPEFKNTADANIIVGELMEAYNGINESIVAGDPILPPDCRFHAEPMANLDADAPVSEWAQGFLHGHEWLVEAWEAMVPEALGEEFAMQIMVLSFFSSTSLAEEFRLEAGKDSLDDMAAAMKNVFPLALKEYARLGRSLQR